MRLYKRKIIFSGPALLEQLWLRKRLKTPAMLSLFPGLAQSVLFRALVALGGSGLVSARWTPARGRPGAPGRIWRPTAVGLEALKVLLPYRDIWTIMDNRDLVLLAGGIKLLGRLEQARQELFPEGRTHDARANYMRRNRLNVGY